jgi:uncharacterized FlaG/YvyC family protein
VKITPTPIVSSAPAQAPAPESQPPQPTQPTQPAPKVETGPLVVDLGGKQIELQPGEMAKVVEKMNETARVFNRTLQFEVGDSNQMIIRVIDTVSGQVVREIPPDKFMDAFHRMEAALGLLLDLKL